MLVTTEGHRGYRFGEFLLDLDRRTLLRDGEEVELRPKAVDLLEVLLEHAGKLVTRQQLLDTVWPDTAVTDDSVSQCLYDIRRALGEEWRDMVRTMPRRGVIFDGPVTEVRTHASRGATARASRASRFSLAALGWAVLAVSAAVLLAAGPWWPGLTTTPPAEPVAFDPPQHSIAVLAFDDLSPAGDSDWFAMGVSEEVLNLLARQPALTVIARTSSFSFSNGAATVPEIGRRLNVAHVLEGSVRHDGQRVRVTAQLVDTRSDAHLWSQTYDGSMGDVFGMQEDIARSVAGMLHAELLGESPAVLTHHPDPEAWPLFLRANHLYNRRGPGDMDHALALYREATEIDPDFARAWAGVAAARSLQVFESGASLDQALPEMEHASQRALELAPDDVVVLLRAARTLRMKGAIDESWALAHRAQRQDPDHPLVLGAMVWWHMIHDPDHERILALQAQAATLDPLNAVTQFNYASGLLGTGQPEQAEAHFRLAKQISPTRREIDYHVALAALLQGRADEARAAAATLPEPLRWKLEAMAAHAQDDPAASARAMAALQGLPGTTNAVHVAEVHAFRGEPAGAVEWLDIARQRLDTHAPNETDLLLIASQGLLLHLAGGDPELGETLNRLHADLAADSRESAASDA